MRPGHAAAATVAIYAQHYLCTSYDAATTNHLISRIDTIFVSVVSIAYFIIAFFVNRFHERKRRSDLQVLSRAKLLHDVSVSIMGNFLPPLILQAVQERTRTYRVNKSKRDKSKPRSHISHDDTLAWEFDDVCVLQSDLVGFTALGSRISPQALCGFLHTLFSHFDDLACQFGVNKIETVGDSFIAATGCIPGDTRSLLDNATALTNMANEMQRHCASIRMPDGEAVVMRIGLHCGPLVGGVVGGRMLRYHLFGPTMDVVAALEHACQPGQIRLSRAFAHALKKPPKSPQLGDCNESNGGSNKRLKINRAMSRIFKRIDSFETPDNQSNEIELFNGTVSEICSNTDAVYEFYPAGEMELAGIIQETFHVISFGGVGGSCMDINENTQPGTS